MNYPGAKSYALVTYVRNKKGAKIGIMRGQHDYTDGTVSIGWSRCHQGDAFDRDKGVLTATQNVGKPVPPSFLKAAKRFRTQCFEHFADADYIQKIQVMEYQRQPKITRNCKVRNSGHHEECPVRRGLDGCRCACELIADGSVLTATMIETVDLLINCHNLGGKVAILHDLGKQGVPPVQLYGHQSRGVECNVSP